jgi:hypothetical protein
MIQQRLVNMGNQADVGSCVPQALAGRRVGILGDVNTWDATPSPVRERWDPVVGRDSGTQATHDRDVGM